MGDGDVLVVEGRELLSLSGGVDGAIALEVRGLARSTSCLLY